MEGLPKICHNFRTEAFQIPIKPFLFENQNLFGNPVITPLVGETMDRLTPPGVKLIGETIFLQL